MPWPDSYCVAARSSITSRTAPSAALAMRSVSCLWSRDVETNASWLESGLHSTSAHSLPRQTTWRGNERQLARIRAPLHVRPLTAPADDVVAQRGPMLVRRHLQGDDSRRFHIHDHPPDHRHGLIARQRILPRMQHGMPHLSLHQVHLAHIALVLLEGGDLLRIGRPSDDHLVGLHPAGVIQRVGVVLYAIGRKLGLLAGCDIAHPQVVFADESRLLLVRRRSIGPATAACRGAALFHCALAALAVTPVPLRANLE